MNLLESIGGLMRVVSSSAPGRRHVGELLLSAMMEQASELQLQLIAITSNGLDAGNSNQRCLTQCVEPPMELLQGPGAGRVSSSILSLRRFWAYERFARHVALNLSTDLELNAADPDPVWVIADSTAVIDCTYYAWKRKNFPFRLQVWDDVRHLTSLKHLDRFSANRVFQRFQCLLRNACDVAVIGEQMASEYLSLGAKHCRVIRHGLPNAAQIAERRQPSETFRIGFCGSAYASDAWKTLLRALDNLRWSFLSRPVELWVVGSDVNFSAGCPTNARFWGRRSVDETTQLMADCDLLYMPQSFQKHHDALTRWSFPTKLSTYVATGRPVLFHTPAWGSLHSFAHEHGFHLLCDSLNPKELVGVLRSLETKPGLLQAESEASVRVANTVLSHHEFRRQTRRFLGLTD